MDHALYLRTDAAVYRLENKPAKQAAKYLPFAGQVASAFLGFGAMMYIGTSHIDECYQIAKATIADNPGQ